MATSDFSKTRLLAIARRLDEQSGRSATVQAVWREAVGEFLGLDGGSRAGDEGMTDPWTLVQAYGELLDAGLTRGDGGGLEFDEAAGRRRTDGAVYTPRAVVERMVDGVWPVLERRASEAPSLRVMDPAVGAGAFLVEVVERWREWGVGASEMEVWGLDRDATAVRVARRALRLAAGGREDIDVRVRCGDALGTEVEARVPTDFDVILGNPPYLSARARARQLSEASQTRIRESFQWVEGAWDLFVPFAERAARWTAEAGEWSLILPNSIWSAQYADRLRRHLRDHALEVVDVSRLGIFEEAAVYPAIVRCRGSRVTGPVRVSKPATVGADAAVHAVARERLGEAVTGAQETPSGRVVSLGGVAEVRVGTAGFDAEATAELIREAEDHDDASGGEARPFIVSGNIRRFAVDEADVRFQGVSYDRPVCRRGASISERRWSLFAASKVVICGMSRRLRAAVDRDGRALGVNTYAVVDTELPLDALAAWLNAPQVSRWYRQRYDSKHLQGGYLGINRGQLESIPVPERLLVDAEAVGRLEELGGRLTDLRDRLRGLRAALEPGRWYDLESDVEPLENAFKVSLQAASWRRWARRRPHDLEDVRLSQRAAGWEVQATVKLRQPDSPRDFIKEGGRIRRDERTLVHLDGLSARRARFYAYALAHRDAFEAVGAVPGGFTRSAAEKLLKLEVPVYDPEVDVEGIVGLKEERAAVERRVAGLEERLEVLVGRYFEDPDPG